MGVEDAIAAKLYTSMPKEGAEPKGAASSAAGPEQQPKGGSRSRVEQMYARTMPSAAGAPRETPKPTGSQGGHRAAGDKPPAPASRALYPKMTEELEGGPGDEDVNGDGGGEGQAPEPGAAPESPLDLEAPAGMDPNDPILGEFKKVADELGLDGPGASRFLEMHERSLEVWRETWDAQVTSWEKSARDDQEIGGEQFDSSIGIARGVVSEFGTRELEDALNAHGYGSHPEFVRLLVRVGKALRDARGSRR